MVDEADDEVEAAISDAVLQTLSVAESVASALRIVWGYLTLPPTSLGDTVLLANAVAPVLSPFVPRADAGGKGPASSVDMAVGKETLVNILRESAEEVNSLTKALQV